MYEDHRVLSASYSGHPFQDKHRKKTKRRYQRPFQSLQSELFEACLPGGHKEDKRNPCTQEQQQDQPAKQQHEKTVGKVDGCGAGLPGRRELRKPGGLRYDDEFVKHKILDAIGDMYMLGKPLLAAYSAFR